MNPAIFILCAALAVAVLASWFYFRAFKMFQPPIGVLSLGDTLFTVVMIVLAPYLYLILPNVVLTILVFVAFVSLAFSVFEAFLKSGWPWIISLIIGFVEIGAYVIFGPDDATAAMVNNITVLITVVGVSNLWVQGGMQARHFTLISGFLIMYDLVATSIFTLTDELIERTARLPFAPNFVWIEGSQFIASIGLGDLIFASTFPIVMWKAFGFRAGLSALVISLATLPLIELIVKITGVGQVTFPVMIVLGPLIVLHYFWWARGRPERTYYQYRLEREAAKARPRSARAIEQVPHQ